MSITALQIAGMNYVTLCVLCSGKGEREQSYTIGCGMGSYSSVGCCDYCKGSGVRMKDGKDVPVSALAQIKERAVT